jgi:predicted GIY-YIG superfamily endonuclease
MPVGRILGIVFDVYAIKSVTINRIYIGHTKDISDRLNYHNSGYVKSTAKDRPWKLIALEKIESKNEARWLERSLKKSRGKRLRWVEKNRLKT